MKSGIRGGGGGVAPFWNIVQKWLFDTNAGLILMSVGALNTRFFAVNIVLLRN